jgi:flagellar motor switch protein FliM
LERYLKAPTTFGTTELSVVPRTELAALLPSVANLVVIGAAPTENKILVELDGALVACAIERLLGGAGDSSRILRPLTEIEAGVLSFIVLKVLAAFSTEWQSGKEVALTLDRFATSFGEIQEIANAVQTYHLLGVRVALGKLNGYARIFIPDALVTHSFAAPPPQGPASDIEMEQMPRTLDAIGDLGVEGRVEIATLDLGPDDIEKLEVGDIVLLENHEISKTEAGIDGSVFVKIGRGKNGGLRGKLLAEGERLRLEITEIVVQEEPVEASAMVANPGDEAQPPADTDAVLNGDGSEDNLSETQGLLRDVAAPVVVELGRIRLNATQVARLKTGQILRLPRGPHDPVDLVVNGKVFARGELIEVDGELGVRLLQVAGGG